mmetsp:Transcript_2577/g.6705  ORF Transcript_2577/g.6705 Transcript_2577/m.6705 type:complete len:380 (-) Transcript_2577:201-1340(-)
MSSTNTELKARAKSSGHSAPLSVRALGYMCLLALQFGLQPILTRRFTPPTVCRTTVIIGQEMLKFFLGLFMLTTSGNFKRAIADWSIHSWITVACVPAALYTVQNLSALVAYQNLDAITFNVLNQTKTLSAALCCYLIIGRKQSRLQVTALILLLVSALVIEKIISLDSLLSPFSPECDGKSLQMSTRHFTHGVFPVLLASFISGLAGAITQKNLQGDSGCGKSGGKNAVFFSMELCVASLLLLAASLLVTEDGKRIKENGFFDEWTLYTMIPIFTNSAGGIVVGLVIKYAGSVRKGFALIFGLLLSGLLQAALEQGHEEGTAALSQAEMLGGMIAALSLYLHATNPYLSDSRNASKTPGSNQDPCFKQSPKGKGDKPS